MRAGVGTASPAPDFRRLFEAAPGCYLVLAPDLTIFAASDAYLRVTMSRREEIIGRNVFEAFPANPDDVSQTQAAMLRASYERVLALRRRDTLAAQRYDIRRPLSEGGAFEERYWQLANDAVLAPDGSIAYIIHSVEDVTERVRAENEASARLRELSTPVVRVHAGILLLPLIGAVDTERSEDIVQTVLKRVVDHEARAVIIDVAGVPVLDTAVADSLLRTAAAVRLLGAHPILTGISASTAKTMVGLDIDVSTIPTRATVAAGIELALESIESSR